MSTASHIQSRTTFAVVGEPDETNDRPIGLLMSRPDSNGEREHALYDLSLEQARSLAAELQNTIWATEMELASRQGGEA